MSQPSQPDCEHRSTYKIVRADGVMLTICAVCHEVLVKEVPYRVHHVDEQAAPTEAEAD